MMRLLKTLFVTLVFTTNFAYGNEIIKLADKLQPQSKGLDNFLTFVGIAKLGHEGRAAGPQVLQYLYSSTWNDRVNAAMTLGYIGYREAIPELLKLTTNKNDWRQVYGAVKALWMLADKSTLPEIERVANAHWYQPLREYAQLAVDKLKSGEIPEHLTLLKSDYYHFSDFRQLSQKNHLCKKSDYLQVSEPVEFKQYDSNEKPLFSFKYRNPLCYEKGFKDKAYCVSDESMMPPAIVAKYKDVWLGGARRGEWGGELLVFERGLPGKIILSKNVEDIYVIGKFAYAITGLAHRSINQGMIYIVSEKGGQFKLEPYYRLPGAPQSSWKISDDAILINTYSGAVIFDPQLGLTMASCGG